MKGDVLKNVNSAPFNTITVNGDRCHQTPKEKENFEITCVSFSKSSKSYIAYLCMKQTEIKYTLII